MVRGRVGSPSHERTKTRTYLLRDAQTHTAALEDRWRLHGAALTLFLKGENIAAFSAEEEHLLQDRRTGGGEGVRLVKIPKTNSNRFI